MNQKTARIHRFRVSSYELFDGALRVFVAGQNPQTAKIQSKIGDTFGGYQVEVYREAQKGRNGEIKPAYKARRNPGAYRDNKRR